MSNRGRQIAQKNTGIPYERVTQVVFNKLVNVNPNAEPTVDILHNVTLQGKFLTHQIDVYWKFEVGGTEFQAIVQAKDWGSKVKQEQMLAFKEVLEDIPGQPRGIYVTRKRYQRGARKLAEACGIDLYVLQPKNRKKPDPIEMSSFGFARGNIKRVPVTEEAPIGWVAEFVVYELEVTYLDLRTDPDTVKNNRRSPEIKLDSPEYTPEFSRFLQDLRLINIPLYNLADEQCGRLNDIVRPLLQKLKDVRHLQGIRICRKFSL